MSKKRLINLFQSSFYILFINFFINSQIISSNSHYTRFEIIVPTYKNENICIKNLESLINQNYPHDLFHITIVNDISPDRTGINLDNYVSQYNLQDRVLEHWGIFIKLYIPLKAKQ